MQIRNNQSSAVRRFLHRKPTSPSGIGWECLRLRLVTLPNLRFLKLAGFPEREGVKKFLSRSACAIDHLVISFAGYEVDVEEDANTIFEWLLEFPTVSVFVIPERPDVAAHLLPRLAAIDKDYNDALIEMPHNRRDSAQSPALRRFHVEFYDLSPLPSGVGVGPGYLAQSVFETLIADGLDFVVKVKSGQTQTWPEDYIGEYLRRAVTDPADCVR
ncbi:hypothetical protein B0H14DRAFT_2588780 [Mycena olivaceomarginata]|nr:hypothetical protein B0H14DRAFT_2588780 [Mycena olivaceomarginata]